MQPTTTREMQAMAAAAADGAAQISLDDLRNGHTGGGANAAAGDHDDFLDQMLSSLPPSAWPDLAAVKAAEGMQQPPQQFGGLYDESAMLASRLRQHQISGCSGGATTVKQMVVPQLAGLRQGHHMMLHGMARSPVGGGGDGLLLPLTLVNGGSDGDVQALLKAAANSAGGNAGVYGGFAGSLQQQQQHFQPHPQHQAMPTPTQSFGGASGCSAQPQSAAPADGGIVPTAPPRQRVRARRGQATDPHSIAERVSQAKTTTRANKPPPFFLPRN
ncbi:hypothetical protein GUJ93_ZPchr0009g2141 [Zizania palustris]|uniref:Uncharacterized protein n=1 Tax=Zizania palustris TaxID=103762 RepID=A0A8J5S530_ZIZPA|nr:hypothetical protein GUJ93_ZPchr0009g2141 [Zizania palustris]